MYHVFSPFLLFSLVGLIILYWKTSVRLRIPCGLQDAIHVFKRSSCWIFRYIDRIGQHRAAQSYGSQQCLSLPSLATMVNGTGSFRQPCEKVASGDNFFSFGLTTLCLIMLFSPVPNWVAMSASICVIYWLNRCCIYLSRFYLFDWLGYVWCCSKALGTLWSFL